MSEPRPTSPPTPSAQRTRYVALLGLIAIILAVWGVVSRVTARAALATETAVEAVSTVSVTRPGLAPATEELVLPGNVQAFFEAPIYARISGYLKIWSVDIGTPVRKGQQLAEIEAPEVDQQFRQAEADLATANANYQLAHTTDERWQGLLRTESVSKQDADEKEGDAKAKEAALKSAAANVARLRELEAFKRIVAPFDGTLTRRNTDVGALINAGQSPGSALFTVADTRRLRVYVSVPQPYAASVNPGIGADLTFAERPGRTYAAQVTSTARALDPVTRTLQVELQVENSKGELFPGSYAEVHFKLPTQVSTMIVPVSALIFRADGVQLATVSDGDVVKLLHVTQGRDLGRTIEIVSGLHANDRVIINPPDSIEAGTHVRVVASAKSTASPPPKH